MGQIGAFVAVIEQLERNIRVVLATWIKRQTQLGNVATLWINRNVQNIRFYVDEVFACSHRCFSHSAGFAIGGWYIGTIGSVVT